MNGRASASTLLISGGSDSSGRLSSAPEMRSRMSFAAASTSRSGENSMVMSDRPSRDEERIISMPSTPATRSSSIWVMRDSTTLAAAPG